MTVPRLIDQLFGSEIFIQIGDRHFQIPKDIFSAAGNSPNSSHLVLQSSSRHLVKFFQASIVKACSDLRRLFLQVYQVVLQKSLHKFFMRYVDTRFTSQMKTTDPNSCEIVATSISEVLNKL